MIRHTYTATCDECGKEINLAADNLGYAYKELHEKGWIVTRDSKGLLCYCSAECFIAKIEVNDAN